MSESASNAEPKKGLGSTALRFATALPLIPLVLWLLFWAPPVAFQIFGLLWIAVVAQELMAMAIPESRACQVLGIANTVGLTALFFYGAGNARNFIAAFFAIVVGALFVSLSTPQPVARAAPRIGWLLGGPIYVAGTLGTVALLHAHDHGGAWVLLAMFAAFFSDTGAYFAGRAFGKHKLYPLVSPKKTVEGAIGGLFAAAFGAGLVQYFLLPHVPLWHAALLGVVAAALGQGGDLLESLIKRSCGVKDSGKIMPGHGGLLDRSDALMFTSATVWMYVEFLAG
ncbi:MAG: phosphatidate cytidylyltransferase [Myxococcota bacterium]